jgi:transglutaminase-like putative cysteine protease
VIYDVRHVTIYKYEASVASANVVLRVTPRDDDGQRRLAHRLDITPTPRLIERSRDFYGNEVAIATIEKPHVELLVDASARVELDRGAGPPAGSGPAWERVVEAALAARKLGPDAPAQFLFSSPRVAMAAEVTAYARASFTAGRSVVDAARELMRRIRKDFVYDPTATDITTPVPQAFAARRGVCQDFAHIMIAGIRGLGIPAAYVSGYIRTIPPPGKPRLQGADATHAWVSVWCGEEIGWLGLDPTNAIDIGNDHIRLAVGRDFSDVSPIYGVFVGSGDQELDVKVDVIAAAN